MADGTLLLGARRYSSWSLRGWLAVRLAALDVTEELIQLEGGGPTSEVARRSPSGLVPFLEHRGIRVWESLAICEYCAEVQPALWPQGLAARTQARAISAEMHAGFRALRQAMPMVLGRDGVGKGRTPEALADVARIETLWRETRERFGGGGPYLFGSLFTAADAMYAPVVARLLTYRPEIGADTIAYCEAVRAHPLLVEWHDLAAKEPKSWRMDHYENAPMSMSVSDGAAATGLDHVGFVAAGGVALWDAFERLGFQLAPFSRHAGRVRADGPIEPWGTGNRCAMLRQGYIELLAIVDAALPVNDMDKLMSRYDGIHILALTVGDEAQALERLRHAGIGVAGVMHLERPVDAADPASPMARFARLPLDDAPEGRIQLIRHLTPEVIWQERWLSHPNRAVSLEAAIIAVPDPAEAAARFSRLAGRPVVPDPAGGFALELAHGVVRLLPPEALDAVLPGMAAPSLPCMAGIVVRTEDGAASARDRADLVRAPDGWMAKAGGAAIVFQ